MRSKSVEVFVGHCIAKGSSDAFEVFRLVLPQSDRRIYPGVSDYRFVYLVVVVVRRLVEQFPGLAGAVSAAGVETGGGAVVGDFYSRLFRWRDKDDLALAMGEPSELTEFLKEKVYDVFCGDHSKSEAERDLARRMGQARSPTVMEVNGKLDDFSDASKRHCVEDQVEVLGWLMQRLSPRQMMWLTKMVLKRTRVWISERDVLEQAPWGEDAVKSFYAKERSFEELLGQVGVGGAVPVVVEGLAEPSEEQGTSVEKTRVTRLPQVVLGNVADGFRYMERRFKPGNYAPMSVIVDAAFDGVKVRICRVDGRVAVEFSDDERTKGMPACEGTVVVEALRRWAVGGKDPSSVDFDIEADIVAWNSTKGCAEPRFVLEALLEADRGLKEGTRVVSDSQPLHGVVRGHLEILILVTDIVSVGAESMVNQYLYARQESLVSFGATHWDAGQGFRMAVRVMPLVSGSTRIEGTTISEVFDNALAIKTFQHSVERLGAKGVMLRAPEAEWSTVEKMARVQVMNSLGRSIINCVVMGYWREHEDGVEGRVSHWLLGVANRDGGGGDSVSSHNCMTAILKLRNHLHITDERVALKILETSVVPVPEQAGMYECNPIATQSPQTQVLLSVAGSLLPPGRWSQCPLVIVPTLLGISPRGSSITSMADMLRMAEEKRMQVTREQMPSVRFRDRKVADRFIPCVSDANTCTTSRSGILGDYNVYFVNHTPVSGAAATRYAGKKRCEELVRALGGTVSQNYSRRVNLVIAGRPTVITNKFREMDIDIMTVAWLERVAAAASDPHGPPLTDLPSFLPQDYLLEWNPGQERREKIEKNFLDLFTADDRNTDGDVSPSKRFKPTVVEDAPAMEGAPDAAAAVARSPPQPSEQMTSRTPPILGQDGLPRAQAPATDAFLGAPVNAPTHMVAQTARPSELMADTPVKINPHTRQTPRIEPSFELKPAPLNAGVDALTPPAAPEPEPGLQVSTSPPTVQGTTSLKQRASSVTGMGSSIPSTASPDGGNVEGSEKERPKMSLRDRARRLGLGTKK